MLYRAYTALLCLFLSVYTSGQAMDTLGIKGANDINIGRYYRYWEDKSRNADAKEALGQFNIGAFRMKSQKQSAFNSGPTSSRFWIVLYLRNDTTFSLPLLWSFYNNDLSITIYEINQFRQPVLLDSLSHLKPHTSRNPKVRMPAYFFLLPPHSMKQFLVAIEAAQTDYTYFYSDISTVEDILAWESGYTLTNGLYAGFFLFVLIINLCLGILLHQKIHFWHGAYVFSVLCYTVSENMLDVLLLPQWLYVWFAHIPKIFFLVISVFFSTKVFLLFVRQYEHYPRFHRIFNVYRYCLFGFILVGSIAAVTAYPTFIRASLFYQFCKAMLLLGNFLLAANVAWGIIKRDRLVLS